MGSPGLSSELHRGFWRGVRLGLTVPEAAAAVGVAMRTALDWHNQAGGVNPYSALPVSGRYLPFSEREEIALGRAEGLSQAEIARQLGRCPSTICREMARNSTSAKSHKPSAGHRYRASFAQSQADRNARRPKMTKLAELPRLRCRVQAGLKKHWSPEEIACRLVVDFGDDEQMRISHETIYKSLYVQGRGGLQRELVKHLRTGRSVRKAHRKSDERRGRITDMVPISARPAEVADRVVPGHFEGDLIIGAGAEGVRCFV